MPSNNQCSCIMLWRGIIIIVALRTTAALRSTRDLREDTEKYDVQTTVYDAPCFQLLSAQDEIENHSVVSKEEKSVSMMLLWNNTFEYAAAALLRATLMTAGYNQDLIELQNRDSMDPSNEDSHALILDVPLKTVPGLQFQAQLTPHAANIDTCIRATKWIANEAIFEYILGDRKILRDCDFIVSETNKSIHTTIYIVHKWNDTCVAKHLRRSIAAISEQLRFLYVEHSNITDLIRNSKNSFFYLDTCQQSETTEVRHVRLPEIPCNITEPTEFPVVINNTDCNLTPVNKTVLLKYAIGTDTGKEVSESFVKFSPSFRDLDGVLITYTNYLKTQNASDDDIMKKAACGWVLNRGPRLIQNWQESARLGLRKMRMAVIICDNEARNFKEYIHMMKLLKDYKNIDVSSLYDKRIVIQTFNINCADTDWLVIKLTSWFKKGLIGMHISFRNSVVGVILPNEIAIAAAPLASKFHLPLLTYDVHSGSSHELLHSATGSVENLVLALRRLLGNCGWQRLAIISEPTQLAVAVTAALRAPVTNLLVKNLNVTSISNMTNALQELVKANARVFLVNTEATTAAAVLDAAQKLDMTRDKGFIWIVREFHAADYATSVTKPYSVSFWWRGKRENYTRDEQEHGANMGIDRGTNGTKITDEVVLRKKLEERWRGRAWPLHAAPLMDALLTLIEAERRSQWPPMSFWHWLKFRPVAGINQIFTFDTSGIISPLLVFVEQWDTKSRPHLLATWHSGEWRGPSEVCFMMNPPSDGSKYCLLPSGDRFQMSCHDFIWIPLIVVAALIGIVFVIGSIYWSHKAFLAHNLHIKNEYAKRILARRERVFEALAEHLVDRSELELLQELGTGRFGRVHQGVLRELGNKRRNVVVAAKSLQEDASSAEESEFLREACTLATLDHEHIIRFVGVCVVDGPPLLLMEHAFFGDLLRYLQARRCLVEGQTNTETINCFELNEKGHVSAEALTKLAQEAATALTYLAQRGIVHRDVRASNCLVDERRCLKLADFGLARATGTVDGEYHMCRRGVLPVLWMAPESLSKGVSSPASDVWSFGVLVFELVTLGRRPYGVQPPPVVLRHVVGGGQPQLPWDASAETRAITRACWRREPESRPTAARLAEWLSTRWRALRPSLVAELVDIDSLIKDNNFDDSDLCPPNTQTSKALTTHPSRQLDQIALSEINNK